MALWSTCLIVRFDAVTVLARSLAYLLGLTRRDSVLSSLIVCRDVLSQDQSSLALKLLMTYAGSFVRRTGGRSPILRAMLAVDVDTHAMANQSSCIRLKHFGSQSSIVEGVDQHVYTSTTGCPSHLFVL